MSRSHWMGESIVVDRGQLVPGFDAFQLQPEPLSHGRSGDLVSLIHLRRLPDQVECPTQFVSPAAGGFRREVGQFVVMPGQAAPGGVERVMRRESVDMGLGDGIERSGGTHETQSIG